MVSTAELTYRSRAFATIGWAMLWLVALVVASVLLAAPSPVWLWVPVAICRWRRRGVADLPVLRGAAGGVVASGACGS